MFTEESLENVVIEYLKDIDYTYIHGSNRLYKWRNKILHCKIN